MRTANVEQRTKRYEAANVEAAVIILGDPERYDGALQRWAESLAHRIITQDPAAYPELTQAWVCPLGSRKRDLSGSEVSNDNGEQRSGLSV